MAIDLSEILVVGVSSRALFNLEKENDVFEKEGVAGYRKFQLENENNPLEPGAAFYLVKSLLNLNELKYFGTAPKFYSKNLGAVPKYKTTKSSEKTSKSSEKKSKSSEKILRLIKANTQITIKELAQELGLSTRTIEKNIAKLKLEKQLERIGGDKGGHWHIVE